MRVLVFGFDAAESSQIRRIRSLVDSGFDVTAFTMRRSNMHDQAKPFWRNIHLFDVPNEQIARRIAILIASCFKVLWHIREVRRADVVMARNFDLLLLALFGRLFSFRGNLPVIYECLDIHGSFTQPGLKGWLFRFVERLMLKRIQLLLVSSPGFLQNYFFPVQRYEGVSYVIENKIWFGDTPAPRRTSSDNVEGGKPWVLGWVGTLRCEPSFQILLKAADLLGDAVRIEMHGIVHHHALKDFQSRVDSRDNITFHGSYRYPEGLGEVYRRLDFVWAQDLWQKGANSDWLLPNRIYEAGYFGCPSIAVSGTQTAETVRDRRLGIAIPAASGEALAELMTKMTPDLAERFREQLMRKPDSDFVYSPKEIAIVIDEATV